MQNTKRDRLLADLDVLYEWLDPGVFTDGTLHRYVTDMLAFRIVVARAKAALLAATKAT